MRTIKMSFMVLFHKKLLENVKDTISKGTISRRDITLQWNTDGI